MIAASAPTRIDFAGGTLDIPPLYLFHPSSCTVNVAIDLKARVIVRRRSGRGIRLLCRDQGVRGSWSSSSSVHWRGAPFLELMGRMIRSFDPLPGCDIVTDCSAPAGAGTGGSSALAIAAAAALARLKGKRWRSGSRLIEHAKGIETQAIRVPTGYQDYVAAVYGGASLIEYSPVEVRRRALADRSFLQLMEEHLFLVYMGKPRFSGANNWELFRRHFDRDGRVMRFFDELRDNALEMRRAFQRKDMGAIARALNRDWGTRRRMLPAMTTPAIERWVQAARRRGALGARVCGAGGGGCVAMIIDPERRPRLAALAAAHEVEVLPVKIAGSGLKVERVREFPSSRKSSRSSSSYL